MLPPRLLQPKKVARVLKEPHPQFLNNIFIDPYIGCEFGCPFCYGLEEEAIDTGEGLSPHRVAVKTSCAFSTKKELSAMKREKLFRDEKGVSIGIGFATDPYQPCENQFNLTRRCLEIAQEASYPVQIITKSELVLRDKEMLSELSQDGSAVVSVSLFTLNEKLSAIFEPRVIPPQKRLELIQKLKKANIVAGAVLMPIFPYLTDSEKDLEKIFSSLQICEALYCVPGILSLSHEPVRKRVLKILNDKFPKAADSYHALYDTLGHPALNYCERIEKALRALSEKYHIPSVLPVEGVKGKGSLILQDNLSVLEI